MSQGVRKTGRIDLNRVDANPGQYDTDYHPSSPDNE